MRKQSDTYMKILRERMALLRRAPLSAEEFEEVIVLLEQTALELREKAGEAPAPSDALPPRSRFVQIA